MDKAKAKNVQIHLPTDFIIADSFSENAQTKTGNLETGIEKGSMSLDIGPVTCENLKPVIARAKLIIWNGYVQYPILCYISRKLNTTRQMKILLLYLFP